MLVALLSVYEIYPVGLRYIASCLEKDGHEVVLAKLRPPFEDSLIQLLKDKKSAVMGLTCYTPGMQDVLELASVSKLSPHLYLDDFSDYTGSSISRELFFLNYRKMPNMLRSHLVEPFGSILSSRGCYYDCDYCPEHVMSCGCWRGYLPETVVDSVERICPNCISGESLDEKTFRF